MFQTVFFKILFLKKIYFLYFYVFDVLMLKYFKKIKKYILIYFQVKNTLKNNRYYIFKTHNNNVP